jgi:hypothetical protein
VIVRLCWCGRCVGVEVMLAGVLADGRVVVLASSRASRA